MSCLFLRGYQMISKEYIVFKLKSLAKIYPKIEFADVWKYYFWNSISWLVECSVLARLVILRQIPDTNTLKKKRLILAYGFGGDSVWSASSKTETSQQKEVGGKSCWTHGIWETEGQKPERSGQGPDRILKVMPPVTQHDTQSVLPSSPRIYLKSIKLMIKINHHALWY